MQTRSKGAEGPAAARAPAAFASACEPRSPETCMHAACIACMYGMRPALCTFLRVCMALALHPRGGCRPLWLAKGCVLLFWFEATEELIVCDTLRSFVGMGALLACGVTLTYSR